MSWEHFKLEEFACKCGCGQNLIESDFIDKLETLRDALGFPLIVTSGYRCPSHNNQVSHTGFNGPHTTGRAADFSIARLQAHELLTLALEHEFTGIGVNQKGGSRFIHLDDLPNGPGQPRPTIWSY